MTYATSFQESDQEEVYANDGSIQNKGTPEKEIKLDSPCTEVCDHPEHGDIKSEEETFRDKFLRTVADSENLRRRLEKEKKDGIDYALFRFAKEIITIADQLSWAVASVLTPDGQGTSLYQGVSMTLSELERVLAQFCIMKVNAIGQTFDPHVHQVMQEQEDKDHAPGTIVSVLQNGYRLQERLLRPAMVVVAKAPTISPDGPSQ